MGNGAWLMRLLFEKARAAGFPPATKEKFAPQDTPFMRHILKSQAERPEPKEWR